MASITLVPAWALKRSDHVETTEGICAVVRIRRAREFGPGQPVDIEMEVLEDGRLIAVTVDAEKTYRRINRDRRVRRR